MISDEPYPAYSRILIPKYLSAESDFSQTRLRPPDFYIQNKIKLLLGREVVKLMLDKRAVEMENGERLSYEKLLLATGGSPIVPKIDGVDKQGVFNFVKLDDVKSIHKYLGNVKRAVVIGGGLIGTSATEALTKRSIKVTVVEMADRMLSAMLDEYASSVVEETLSGAGVEIATGHTVASITGEEAVQGVILDDGTSIECQMVVIAIGVAPRIDLAEGTDIEVERGIVVDLNMKTSHTGVYACGDVAEVHDYVHGKNRVVPIWPGAHFGGRIAGLNMAGSKTEYMGCTGMNTMGYFGLNVASAGITTPPDDSYEVLVSKDYGNYQKLVIKDNIIVGMVLVGSIDKGGIVINMMRDRADICDIKSKLIPEDACGLTYLLWKLRSRACRY